MGSKVLNKTFLTKASLWEKLPVVYLLVIYIHEIHWNSWMSGCHHRFFKTTITCIIMELPWSFGELFYCIQHCISYTFTANCRKNSNFRWLYEKIVGFINIIGIAHVYWNDEQRYWIKDGWVTTSFIMELKRYPIQDSIRS